MSHEYLIPEKLEDMPSLICEFVSPSRHSGKLYVVRVGKNLESSQNSNSILISQFIYLFLLAMQIFVLIHPLVSPKIAKKIWNDISCQKKYFTWKIYL